jgi:hypothetical protein
MGISRTTVLASRPVMVAQGYISIAQSFLIIACIYLICDFSIVESNKAVLDSLPSKNSGNLLMDLGNQ